MDHDSSCPHFHKPNNVNASKCLAGLKKAGVEFPPVICLKCGKLLLDDKSAYNHFEKSTQHPLYLNIDKSELTCLKCSVTIGEDDQPGGFPSEVGCVLSAAFEKKGKLLRKKTAMGKISDHQAANVVVVTDVDNNTPTQLALPRTGDRGLKNLGNTCYMNSSLQMLARCRALSRNFVQSHGNEAGPICAEFYRLLMELRVEREVSGNAALNPRSFFDLICRDRFGDDQQDAEEFLLHAFAVAGMEINGQEAATKTESKYIVDHNEEEDVAAQQPSGSWEVTDPIANTFGVETKSMVICQTCKSKTITVERAPVIHLNFPAPTTTTTGGGRDANEDKSSFQLDDLIAMHMANTEITTFRCATCAKQAGFKSEDDAPTQRAIKSVTFGKLPEAILMVLARFNVSMVGGRRHGGGGKLTKNFTHVDVPKSLNLERFTSCKAQPSFDYELKGVVSHLGSTLYGGHYVALCRRDHEPDSWVHISDDTLRRVPRTKSGEVEAYCVLYERGMQDE